MKKQIRYKYIVLLILIVLAGCHDNAKEDMPPVGQVPEVRQPQNEQVEIPAAADRTYTETIISKADPKIQLEGLIQLDGAIVYRDGNRFVDVENGAVIYELTEADLAGKRPEQYAYGASWSGTDLIMVINDDQTGKLMAKTVALHGEQESTVVELKGWSGTPVKVLGGIGDPYYHFPKILMDENYIYVRWAFDHADKGRIFKLTVFTKNGDFHMETECADFDIDGNGDLYTSEYNTQIYRWNVAERKRQSAGNIKRTYEYNALALDVDEDSNTMYVLTKYNLDSYSAEDCSRLEIVMPREGNMIDNWSVQPDSMIVLDRNTIYMRADENIFKYCRIK